MSETAIEKREQPMVPAVDLMSDNLPNLHNEEEAFVIPTELESTYWKPEDGEVQRGFIQDITVKKFPDQNDTSKLVDVKVVELIAQSSDGTTHKIMNGGKRLVNTVEAHFKSGKLISGSPVEIIYKGKEKNATNNKMSGKWSVKPILIKSK